MKILVLSDTHGDTQSAEEAVNNNLDSDLVIHLGDFYRDAQKLAELFPDLKFEYIYGNSDFMIGEIPAEKKLDIQGLRIYATHGHRYSVKWELTRIHKLAAEEKADILLFGHTHIPGIAYGKGYMLVNPGSISDPRRGTEKTYAVIEINSGKADVKICSL